MDPRDAARKERALARTGRIMLHKTRAGELETDFSPVGGSEAISLATRLSSEAHSLAGVSYSALPRKDLPIQFVPRASS